MSVEEAIDVLAKAGAVFCPPPDDRRSLPLAQAARWIGFSTRYVRDHLAEFPGAWRAPGGELRIPVADVEAFTKRHRIRP